MTLLFLSYWHASWFSYQDLLNHKILTTILSYLSSSDWFMFSIVWLSPILFHHPGVTSPGGRCEIFGGDISARRSGNDCDKKTSNFIDICLFYSCYSAFQFWASRDWSGFNRAWLHGKTCIGILGLVCANKFHWCICSFNMWSSVIIQIFCCFLSSVVASLILPMGIAG